MPHRFLGQHVIRCQARNHHTRCTNRDVCPLSYPLPHPRLCSHLGFHNFLYTALLYDSHHTILLWLRKTLQIVLPKETFVDERGLVQPRSR